MTFNIQMVTRETEKVKADNLIGAFRNEEGKFYLRWKSGDKEKIRQITKKCYDEIGNYFERRK